MKQRWLHNKCILTTLTHALLDFCFGFGFCLNCMHREKKMWLRIRNTRLTVFVRPACAPPNVTENCVLPGSYSSINVSVKPQPDRQECFTAGRTDKVETQLFSLFVMCLQTVLLQMFTGEEVMKTGMIESITGVLHNIAFTEHIQ